METSGGAKGGTRAWVVWLLAASVFGFAFFQRVVPGTIVDDLMREFAIGGALLGTLSALYFYPYVILQVPLGALYDQLGARIILSVGMALAAAGTLVFAVSDTLWLAYLGRILIGIGAAVGFLGTLSIAGRWFPPERFAFLAGLSMFIAMICGMAAQAPLAVVVSSIGWRTAMTSSAIVAFVLALLIVLFVQNAPDHTPRNPMRDVWREVGRGLWQAAKLWRVWRIALIAAAMSGPMLTIAGLWGIPYLMQAYDLT